MLHVWPKKTKRKKKKRREERKKERELYFSLEKKWFSLFEEEIKKELK